MKREGRIHGMVRTLRIVPLPLNPRPEPRYNRVDPTATATAGLFTKVSRKPTNHSKFTGKCEKPRCVECHIHPPTKSKAKAKGTQKLRVVCRELDSEFSGSSATGFLDLLDDYDDEQVEAAADLASSDSALQGSSIPEVLSGTIESRKEDGRAVDDDDDDDNTSGSSFCDVGPVWEQEQMMLDADEGWLRYLRTEAFQRSKIYSNLIEQQEDIFKLFRERRKSYEA